MFKPNCKICGTKMMKNGVTSSGAQRWRRDKSGSSSVHKIDSSAKWLAFFGN